MEHRPHDGSEWTRLPVHASLGDAARLADRTDAVRVALVAEDYEAAIELANALLHADSDARDVRELRALAYFYSEDFVEAIDDFDALLQQAPDNAAALAGRGLVYVELREFELAERDLTSVIDASATSTDSQAYATTLAARGLARAGMGRSVEAEVDLAEAERIAPHNASVHFSRGQFWLLHRRRDLASLSFQRALQERRPALAPYRARRARALAGTNSVA